MRINQNEEALVRCIRGQGLGSRAQRSLETLATQCYWQARLPTPTSPYDFTYALGAQSIAKERVSPPDGAPYEPLRYLVEGDRVAYLESEVPYDQAWNLWLGVGAYKLRLAGIAETPAAVWVFASLIALPRRLAELADPAHPLLVTPFLPPDILLARLAACSRVLSVASLG